MMDWLTNYLPDGSDLYWAILCTALVVLNVWQFAKARGLTAKLDHVFEHGHPPEGMVLVPAPSVTPPPAAAPPGWTDPATSITAGITPPALHKKEGYL